MSRFLASVLSTLAFATGLWLVAQQVSSASTPGLRLPSGAAPPAASLAAGALLPAAQDRSGVPVLLTIPIGTSNHPDGVVAEVSADPLTEDGDLFVPSDPRRVSWASEDAAPGAARGTAILTGHVNYVVDGELVVGALSDLAEYALDHVGETFTVTLSDGRDLTYRITGGEQYDKDELAARPELRRELYDQESAYGDGSGTGRLVLVSCGGAFDRRTGVYEDNVFLFALPVG